jgi:hypothetical protein
MEMNALELEFLFSINFALQVPTEVYEKYNVELVNHVTRTAHPCDCCERLFGLCVHASGCVLSLAVCGWVGAQVDCLQRRA